MGEIARQQRAECFARPLTRLLLLGRGVAAQRAGGEDVLRSLAGLAQLERADSAEREFAGLAAEVVHHDPFARAAAAQTNSETGKVVAKKGFVAGAGWQRKRLDGGGSQLH